MRYCPYCQRINVGRSQICNYCGRTWYIKLCHRGHENPYDVQYCGTCGSTDLTDPAGPRPWWSYAYRCFILGTLILLSLSLGRNFDQFLPQLLTLMLPIIILIVGYSMIVSIAPSPLNRVLRFINKILLNLGSRCLAWLWNMIKKIFN